MAVTARRGPAPRRPDDGVSPPPALVAHGLSKAYGRRQAVDSLDLEVEVGTVVGFLGPNGAGKTTAIRMLCTVLAPDAGSIAVMGIPHTRPQQIRQIVGVLPEGAGYPRTQTSEEWLTYHAQLFGISRRAARNTARRLLAEVGLADRGRSLISGLSRGMRQRLGIARALVNDPRVVFLDEPSLGLDPGGQRQVLDLVSRIAREHRVTVVLSTHVLAEVEQVCDRVVILNHGRVVADGTVTDVVRRAAAPRQAVLRVTPERHVAALQALHRRGLVATSSPNGHRDELYVTLPGVASCEQVAATVLGTLLEAGVPVLGFTLEGGRLSDAFLAVTGGGPDDVGRSGGGPHG